MPRKWVTSQVDTFFIYRSGHNCVYLVLQSQFRRFLDEFNSGFTAHCACYTLVKARAYVVKVKNVEMLNVSTRNLSDGVGFVSRCTWNVSGSVGHWGHIHQRTNQYEAELTVKPVDGVWKITDLELLQEERI